ncbi:MAG: glutathione S-transferase N-terminal domain-containing protein, partial [Gammaproteobacteria bacterium]|nr:glutathione S-transferase N-terminal domain-containing protein [Gammaproteobacteria bacterium]
MTMQLVSFKLCPFVQRSVITLIEKGVDYDITYIDLAEPPDWFL